MKITLLLLLVSALFLGGCKDNSSLLSPENAIETSQPLKLFPADTRNQSISFVNFSKVISGAKGGQIDFEHSFPGFLTSVKVKGRLIVPAKAYQGTKEITLKLNDKYAYVDFGPSPTSFNTPLLFDVEYTNMDLLSFVEGLLDFGYMAPDNGFYGCKYDDIYMNILKRQMGVKGARLEHFSRYGFTKRNID